MRRRYGISVGLLTGLLLVACRSGNESQRPPLEPVVHPPLATDCVGATDAAHQAVYLHGMMPVQSVESAAQERILPAETALLDRLGKELNIRFAIPYSKSLCRNSSTHFCWGTAEPVSVAHVYADIRPSVQACFAANASWGVIGFSNGGYHAGRVIAQGHLPQPSWAIAIGSAGAMDTIQPTPAARSTPFYLLIGTADVTRSSAQHFYNALYEQGFNVQYREFAGGHELDENALRATLQEILK